MTTETQVELASSQGGGKGKKDDLSVRFFDLMQAHVKDMPYTLSQKENLGDLLALTKQRWSDIIQQKEDPSDDAAVIISHDTTLDPRNRTNRSILGEFCRDLTCASFAASMNAGSEGPSHYQLSGMYKFTAELGPKDQRFKKHISVLIAVSANPEVVMINYPGERILAVEVGSCQQFDSAVYFGDDGKIYLVESELSLKDPPIISGRKVYESEETLLWSWRRFTMV